MMKKSKGRIITLMAFCLSISLHAGIFTGLYYISGGNIKIKFDKLDKKKNVEKIFSIEAIDSKDLPDINKMAKESKVIKNDSNSEKKLKKEELAFENQKVKVESMNDKGEETLRFEDIVKLRIQKVREYPEAAKKSCIQGDVYLSFEILKNGSLGNIDIIQSSGNDILDAEAINTIKRAVPFPTIPDYYDMQKMNLKVKIIYKLN